MNRMLRLALGKLKYIKGNKLYCGYLTPVEILLLLHYGITTHTYDQLSLAKEDKKNGVCNPRQFYCHLPIDKIKEWGVMVTPKLDMKIVNRFNNPYFLNLYLRRD